MKNYYADPTANTAIANVDRELRMQRKREEQLKKAALVRDDETAKADEKRKAAGSRL